MKSYITKFIIGILLIYGFRAQNAKEIAKNCLPSTVSIILENKYKQPIALGSGFIIERGKIVTNLHVIEGAKYGYVLVNGEAIKHKVEGYISIDKKNDIAILSVPTITKSPLLLSDKKQSIGERIYAIGNPKGLSGTISEGIISGIRNLEDKELIQITAPISPGSSGGPVVNNSGEVIGIAVGTINSGQNLNFAIPSRIINQLAENETNSVTPLNISEGETQPKLSIDEKDIKNGILIRDWKYKYGVSSINVESHHKLIKSISFKNELPYTVANIRTIFILYDKHGVPVDYFEMDFFTGYGWDGIKPFLAKTITFDISDWESHRALRKESGENLEVIILDFEIEDEND
jgi:hypothetical protein